jgi:hypothetical protein
VNTLRCFIAKLDPELRHDLDRLLLSMEPLDVAGDSSEALRDSVVRHAIATRGLGSLFAVVCFHEHTVQALTFETGEMPYAREMPPLVVPF